MRQSHVVVVGGGYAGLLAAARAARGARVTLVDRRGAFEQRIRLHEALAGAEPAALPYAPALARRGVAFAQAGVAGLDLALGRVRLEGGGPPRWLGYDMLIVALGSATAAGAPGVAQHALRLDDMAAVRRAAPALRGLAGRGGRALVAGGGLTAIEAAAELAERLPGLRVTLAAGGEIGAGYSAAAAAYLRARLAALGVELLEGARVAALEPGRAWLADGRALAYDACVWAGGFAAPALLAEAGLATDAQGRALVGADLRAPGQPALIVAGDCAASGARPIRMGCVSAMPMGAYAGEAALGWLAGAPPPPLSFGFPGRCVSLGRGAGLVQLTDRDDRPRERAIVGRAGAVVKELVCAMTLAAIRAELRSGLPLYRWTGAGERPARAAAQGA